jgi:hypothetical protein
MTERLLSYVSSLNRITSSLKMLGHTSMGKTLGKNRARKRGNRVKSPFFITYCTNIPQFEQNVSQNSLKNLSGH